MTSAPLKTFIIYARDDEAYKSQLLLHLRPLVVSGLLTVWHDGNILPGEDWEKAIKKELKSSELVIMLVSVNSLNSDFIQTEELRTALDGLDAGLTRVVPVVVSPCVWKFDPVIRRLQALPLSGADGVLPVSEWKNANLAWAKVVEAIGDMVMELNERRREQQQQDADRQEQEHQAAEKARIAAARRAEEDARKTEKARLDAEKVAEKARIETEKRAEQQRIAEQKRLQQEAALAAGREAQSTQSANSPTQGSSLNKWLLGAAAAGILIVAAMFFRPGGKEPLPGQEPTHITPSDKPVTPDEASVEKAWTAAQSAGSLPAFRNFREQYPNSKYDAVALKKIGQLKKEAEQLVKDAEIYLGEGLKEEAYKKLNRAAAIDPENTKVKRLLSK